MAFDFKTFGETEKTKIPTTISGGGFDFNSFGTTTPFGVEKQEEPNYFQRVGGQYQKAGQDIISGIKTGAEQIQQGNALGGIRAGLRTVGGVASSAFAPILEAPIIKPLTEKIIGKALENPEIKSVVTKATELTKQYPNASKDIQNIVDIATLGGGSVAEKPLIQEGRAIARDITQGAKVLLTPSEEVVQNKVISLFNKSIKPTAKKTLAQGQKYENDTLNALKTIKANVNDLNIEDATGELISGRTPQTIQELSQALEQTKDIVFRQYDEIAKNAGKQGAIIDAKPIADEVLKVTENKAIQLKNPELIKYAEDWSKRLKNFDVLDTETTQEVIKMFNNDLRAFYSKPSYESASKAVIDAGIANNFRQALDKAIEGATGEQYQILKRQYGALKAIENDVTRASMRDARKNVKGLLDYSDMFTNGQMITGILSLNPAMFTKGAVERGFKEYFKFLNDPNRAIGNIFDKLNIETGAKFTPTSATGKFIANPKLGMSIEDVSKNNPLIQEARKYKSAEEFIKSSDFKVEYATNKLKVAQDGKPVTVTVYHGSPDARFAEEFNPSKKGYFKDAPDLLPDNTQWNELYGSTGGGFKTGTGVYEGISFTDDFKVAKSYADKPAFESQNSVPMVLERTVTLNKPKVIDVANNEWKMSLEKTIEQAKKEGYDGIIFKNIKDNYHPSTTQKPSNNIIAFSPSQIKTKSQLTDIWKKANKK